MSQEATTYTPELRQSVRFGERYVSSALNQKLAGILGHGVYHGYLLKPGPAGKVLVTHDEDYPRSVAIVERDGYNLTIIMDDPVYVQIPATGTWNIVIEAFYVATQPGYQRIVAREQVESHHVLLGTVTVENMDEPVTEECIDTSVCVYSDTREQADSIATILGLYVDQAALFARLSDRVTKLELKQYAADTALLQRNYVVENITARDALTSVNVGDFCHVIDASGDETVNGGAALYIWQSSTVGWVKECEAESLDALLALESLPTSMPAGLPDGGLVTVGSHVASGGM